MSSNLDLKPWMKVAFELIVHAETHLRDGGDFDRRLAHIGFDNAIEVAIATYLALNPIQRNGKTYKREEVDKWLANYHTKLGFLEKEAQERGLTLKVPRDEVIFYHEIRNDQYHQGGPGVPEGEHLEALRSASLDCFAMLFGVNDVEKVLERCLQERRAPRQERVVRNDTVDKLLDMAAEPVIIAGQPYSVSELLHATDQDSYKEVATSVTESRNILSALSAKYPRYVRPDLAHVSFVHHDDAVYLKTVDLSGEISLTDTGFITGGEEGDQYFSSSRSADQNADLLLNDFDPFSIINCFDLFTDEAAKRISREYDRVNSGPGAST